MFMTGVLCTVCGAQVYFHWDWDQNSALKQPWKIPACEHNGDQTIQFLLIKQSSS